MKFKAVKHTVISYDYETKKETETTFYSRRHSITAQEKKNLPNICKVISNEVTLEIDDSILYNNSTEVK